MKFFCPSATNFLPAVKVAQPPLVLPSNLQRKSTVRWILFSEMIAFKRKLPTKFIIFFEINLYNPMEPANRLNEPTRLQ